MSLAEHQHGKARVRVGRTWRVPQPDGTLKHVFVEWNVQTALESDMAHAFTSPSNEGMTATDTQRNTVYYVAKQLDYPCSPEDFGLALARHFLKHYPLVSRAKVRVAAAPWARHTTPDTRRPHVHGYEGGGGTGGGERLAYVSVCRQKGAAVIGGVSGWRVLKTTASGYEGFLRDAWTALPDSRDRILATSISCTWRYTRPAAYDASYAAITAAMARQFFGPPAAGVYSPSVQFTAHEMARAALAAEPAIDSIALSLPNLHFIPTAPLGDGRGFQDDVYTATSEPHGVIEAVVVREGSGAEPHVRLWGDDGLGPAARL